jgi:hypothetical protein
MRPITSILLFVLSSLAPSLLLGQIDVPPIPMTSPRSTEDEGLHLNLNAAKPAKKITQWIQLEDFRLTNDRSARQKYLEIDRSIEEIENKIKWLSVNDSDAKPKDPFETTQAYQIRRDRLLQKIEEIKNTELIPLENKKNEYENVYLRENNSNIKIKIDPNNYSADMSRWKIEVVEENGTASPCTIFIKPEQARSLWDHKDHIRIVTLSAVTQKNTQTIFFDIDNDPIFNGIALNKIELNEDEMVYEKVEIEASFPGGEAKWRQFMERNLSSFNPADEGAPAGTYTTYVQFVVDKEGNISEVKAITNHGYGMEDAAVRIIKKGPRWSPAIQNQRPVKAYRKQPITFRVEEQ